MIATICKSELSGIVGICPSKSYEQRAWAMSSLPRMEIAIHSTGSSSDANASKRIADKIKDPERHDNVFYCGESALCARMFPPIIAIHTDKFTIDGHGSLRNRNIRNDLNFYEQTFGWKISGNGLPIDIGNAKITPGNFHIDGSRTSQVTTGLMLALSALNGDSTIRVVNPSSTGYILMTAAMANYAGAKINVLQNGNTLEIKIKGNDSYLKAELNVEGDWSNAAFLIAAGMANGGIKISGLNSESLQPDRAIIDALYLCNAKFEWSNGNLIIHKSGIHGFEFDASNYPDLIPPLCAIALHATSKSKIFGANRLIGKESNRLEAIITELGKLGANITCTDNCLTIQPCTKISSATVDSHNDHRIAMMLAILGLSSEAIVLNGCKCVNKSYPDFFDTLKQLGANITIVQ